MSNRVESTSAAREMLTELWNQHGPLLIHQSGGCCDGSVPMCLTVAEFRMGDANERLGTIDLGDGNQVAVWTSASEARLWEGNVLLLDLEPGRASGFSLEGSSGSRFISRVKTSA